jgi:HK97 family phage portal protein
MHVGLSPVAYAAWTIGEYLSIQDFALDWFGNGTIPAAILKNKKKTVSLDEAAKTKARFKASVQQGDLFVTGDDWDYQMVQAQQAGMEWIEAKRYGISDIARFFDCPGDLIDAVVSGQSVTYANITQRNLQLLIMNLGPAVVRREAAFSKLVYGSRYVKLNTDALLRMDPKARAETLKLQIESRQRAPSEARELDNLPPFTAKQLEEFATLFGAPRTQPTTATAEAV